jgi:hypothetical protein
MLYVMWYNTLIIPQEPQEAIDFLSFKYQLKEECVKESNNKDVH